MQQEEISCNESPECSSLERCGSTATRDGRSEDPLALLRQIEDQRELEKEACAAVAAILSAKGEAAVQKLLQEEIRRVKKVESDVAAAKKRVVAAGRGVDEAQLKVRRELESKAEAERICAVLQNALRRREANTSEAVKEMEARRLAVREKVEQNISDVRAKCDEKQKQTAEMEEENVRLRAVVDEKKREFDEAYATYQDDWAEREQHVEALMRSSREVEREIELLEKKLSYVRQERKLTEATKLNLQHHLEAYEAHFEQYKHSQTIEEAEKTFAQQREEVEKRLAQLENEKKEAQELRLKFDKETIGLRGALATAKRELQKIERDRHLAEKRCRLAQEKAREREKEKEKEKEKCGEDKGSTA
ncbi:hypothetical protein ERJ75_000869400 [Trypanosoma vivax]|uniref:Uncharacterized protein n=1 Tax=Trypanosoma vivax (strain Y486) TaxID=1055687 RepID=G0TXT3_TRYVY|nr:hypothetical protein TRVL_07986 [Trypanosoma vivax]KAH8612524.1 hypothetical protein ERJ75_000869400 [Trypanosoma vivax]CCC48775.1 conserved hypothetical protein [Trypanosoma vivax Y486]